MSSTPAWRWFMKDELTMKEIQRIDAMRRKVRRIHFVGIGGIGMSGIAEVLLNLGYDVSGSDLNPTDITHRLVSLGAAVHSGHRAENVGQADVVVTSTAVRQDNPEVLEAHRKGIPVIPRAEMLAELLKMKFSIAVSGSHGKTTTTSMISTVLAYGKFDPTMVIGGKLSSIGSNAKIGDGEIIVAEADESDRSFLKLGPTLAVITNIDLEHLDHYRDIEDIKEAFLQFANIVPFYGSTVLCIDSPHAREIFPMIKRRTITYGLTETAEYRAERISFTGAGTGFDLYFRDQLLGAVQLNVPGMFNVYNAMATIAVASEIGMPFPDICEGIKTFTGVQRRLELKGTACGIRVVDDYGHHPTEILATLAAAKQVWPDGRLVVVFQPHRYTRTKGLFKEFLACFKDADVLIVMDIYAASEEPIPGITSQSLCDGIREAGHPHVVYMPKMEAIVDYLKEVARPTDTIITQGAGSVWKIGEAFLQRMAEPESDQGER
jgi:UDP-N-acetylmuramate--alanine ligase